MASEAFRYRLAFFTVDWNYELVENTLHGLKQYTEEHPDVQICVFDCFGKDLGNDNDWSEYAVFRLPDLSGFDGLLVQGNQIVLKEARDMVAKMAEESGIPTISIGCRVGDSSLVYFDNTKAEYEMTDHIIREHGARRLVYLTGIMDNDCPEGPQRLDGFMDACRDNQIPAENVEVIRCTWRNSDGVNVARLWIRGKDPLPDAFICANDEMAFGLMETLREHGIRVPRDVLVCGFDNLSSAELSSPRLSTVHTDHSRLTYFAADAMIRKIQGTENRKEIPFGFEMIFSESCGCHNIPRKGLIRDLYFQQTSFLKSFYFQQDKMAEDLFEAGDLQELMRIIGNHSSIFGCDRAYLCVNEYYYINYDKSLWPDYAESFDRNMVFFDCGADADEPEKKVVHFPTASLLPESRISLEPFLIVYPLHYNTYSIGYVALNGLCSAAKLNLHESIFNFMAIAIENVRKKSLLHNMNEMLDDLYVHDALTGLYNRFGMPRFGQQSYDNLMASEGSVQVLFIDLDDMKSINDRFGHETGDTALKITARILRETCSEQAFIMRYGGDEFIVIDSGRRENLAGELQDAAEDYNRRSGMPFRISFSSGTIFSDAAERRPVEECVQAADSLMYRNKQEKKGH